MGNGVQDPQSGGDHEMGGMEEDFKGKGVAPHAVEEEEDDDEDSSEEEGDGGEGESELVEDNMEEIDTGNIIQGGRTRGKQIDYNKVADENPAEDEEDEDDDYVHQEDEEDKMH